MAHESKNRFVLWNPETSAALLCSEGECRQIKRACGDLQNDIYLVTGCKPQAAADADSCDADRIIVAGLRENNGLIDELARKAGIDLSEVLAGRERYCIFEAELSEGRKALAVTGSDMRGCIYGIYKISSSIGVSPFYWWSDVTPVRKNEAVIENLPIISQSPSVEYRGVFINDERNFQLWGKKFEDKAKNISGSPNLFVYEKVFELLLRLGANTLWPAMHPYSTPFNKVTDENGVPVNAKAADDYGIIVGTSHCENMLRNNVGEWEEWAQQYQKEHKCEGKVKYDYTVSPEAVNQYWEERIETNKGFENIYTLGMRGIHDGSMSMSKVVNPSLEDKIRVTNEIIRKQRSMLEKVYGDNLPPQIFVPYKEAADLYNGEPRKGIKGIELPDDVTLMWADDNHGYIRQFPNEREKQRSGGNGVYYHVSYWGYPCSYLWINSTPLGMIHREFTTAYEKGIRKIFIINVGDIKPAEISLAFQMQLLYTMDDDPCCAENFLRDFGKRTFGFDEELSKEFAFVVQEYYRLAVTLRPEFCGKYSRRDFKGKTVYSAVHNYDEAAQTLENFSALIKRSEKLKAAAGEALQDAYYELIHYMIISAAAQIGHHIYWQKYELSLLQGRKGSIEMYRALSEKAYGEMMEHVRYFNEDLNGGKWNGIMNPYPKVFKPTEDASPYQVPKIAPKRNFRKKLSLFRFRGTGISAQDETLLWKNSTLVLDNLTAKEKFIDVFSKSGKNEKYTAEKADYITLEGYTGSTETEERLLVKADWEKLPKGTTKTKIKFISSGKTRVCRLILNKYDESYPPKTHVESDFKVSISAPLFSSAKCGGDVKVISYPGRSREAVMMKEGSEALEYNVYFHSKGEFILSLCRIPTLNEGSHDSGVKKEVGACVELDNKGEIVLKGCGECYEKINGWLKPRIQWRNNVYRHIEYLTCKIKVEEKGLHRICVRPVNSDLVFDRILIYTKGKKNSYSYPPSSYNTF